MSQTVITCKAHHQMVTESLLQTEQTNQTRCACCGKPRTNRPYDEYDLLAEKYHITRSLLSAIESFAANKYQRFESLQAFIVEKLPVNNVSHGYAPVTVHCHSCHSSFRFHMYMSLDRIPPTHCVFCGSTQLTTDTDNELDVWETLANAYGVSIELVKFLYTGFTKQRVYLHFSEYLTSLKG